MGNSKSLKKNLVIHGEIILWGRTKKDALIEGIKKIEPCKKDLKCLRILLAGPCGHGKSSFINSVNNAFKGRITSCAQTDRIGDISFTNQYKPYEIECGNSTLPVVFNDVMGLETGSMRGCPVEDIIKAIHGHVRPGHVFNPGKPVSPGDEHYIEKPTISDQAFCPVYVLAADRIQFAEDSVLHKMRDIRMQVRSLALPQVIVLTFVDEACPLVKRDLQKIYVSKKIKEKMQWCSNKLGVSMCHIFPVKNYHEEIETNDDMDVLVLQALTQIMHLANDNMKERSTPAVIIL